MSSAWTRLALGFGLLPLASCVSTAVTDRSPASSAEYKTRFVSVDSLREICKTSKTNANDPELLVFDLNSTAGRDALVAEMGKLDRWIEERSKSDSEDGSEKTIRRQCRPSKKIRVGLKEASRILAKATEVSLEPQDRLESLSRLAVVAESVTTNFRYPIPRKIEGLVAPALMVDRMTNYIGEGNRGPAINPDVQSSTLWTKRADIPHQDLFFGFDRESMSLDPNTVCKYDEAKSGYGTRPGFDMKCAKTKFKIRFGPEVHTSPFSTRIFWALGFNVPAFDHVAAPRIEYDRKMLTEFNTRADLTLDITALGVKVYKYDFQKHFDPFDFIREAILKDGERVSASELKKRLFKNHRTSKPELVAQNFQEEFEAKIDHLVLDEAGVSPKIKGEEEIGGWDWNALDYPSRREFRGAGVLAGWLNWYDDRWDNNKVIIEGESGNLRLKHAITDLGSSLGNARGMGFFSVSDANGFPWGFIEPRDRPEASGNIGLIRNYSGFDRNDSFLNSDTEDAKWMARQIAQLTEEQIKQALIASGYSAAETKMFTEKLLYRRDSLLKVYGLTNEFALLRKDLSRTGFEFDWDPSKEPMIAQAKDDSDSAPEKGLVIRKGVVCEKKKVARGTCREPLPGRH